jgi:uncharacterized membrane protein
MSTTRSLAQSAWRTFLSGLATVLPVAITAYLLWWLAGVAESLFGGMARFVLPDGYYLPGFGLLMAIGLVFIVGAFLNAWLFRCLVDVAERMVERIPVVKTIYGGLRDLSRFFSGSAAENDLRTVVAVELQPGAKVIGFVTDNDAGQGLPELTLDDDRLIAVYLPMGYQIGGYTLYMPASRVQELDMSVEEAMRVVLTAGLDRPSRAKEAAPAR